MTSFSVCALLIGGLLASRPAYAESYNLRCSVSGSEMARLVVRDNWISHHMPPDVRVILSKPGETAPVDLKSYTDDKVRIPMHSAHLYRFQIAHRSNLKPPTVLTMPPTLFG